ncbi:MAG: B12-binding domain-containing radical SAM protein [Candidatus Tectimicrobiota bacterium]
MRNKNVLLVYPEFATSFWSFKFTLQYLGKKSSMPSLGLLTLAGMFPSDYTLRLVDMNVQPLTDADIQWADLICTSTMIVQRKSLDQVIARAKQAGKPVVAGGPHPTSYWEEIEDVDYFLLGEVETTFPRFLSDLEHGTAQPIYLPPEKPAITQTPIPRYDLINMQAYGSMLLQFSRGCPFDCEFCDITKLYGRIPRTKSPEQMLAEFDLVYNLGWRGALFLVDDNFIGNRRDALRLLRALIPWQRERNYPFALYTEASMNLVEHDELMEAMIQAGFTSVFVGIETPTAAALLTTKKSQNVDKDDPEYPLHAVHTLQAKGFEVMGGFILGLDGEPPDVFDLHIEFIQQAAIPMAMEGMLTVLKDTNLYHRMQREGRLRGDTTGNNLDTHLNFVPEMDETLLKAGYTRVLNTIYDRRLEQYFARCWSLLQRMDRRQAPTPMSTPLRVPEMLRFLLASFRQLLSPQGPAYARFLSRVLRHQPAMFREALSLAAKGYHLRKITEQLTAVDNLKHYLRQEIDRLQTEIARCAHDGQARLQTYVHEVLAHIRREYDTIHQDFRHDVDEALHTFVRTLDSALKGLHVPITIPMRFS